MLFQLVLVKLSAEQKTVKLLWVAYLSSVLVKLLWVAYLSWSGCHPNFLRLGRNKFTIIKLILL
jgi:hypothetical protein